MSTDRPGVAGKVALVTGGGKGIGRAISLALAESGADVAVNYRQDDDAAAEVVRLIEKDGRRAVACRADVADPDQARALVDEVRTTLGPVDLLVNNAGYGMKRGFLANEVDEEVAMLDVLCTAVLVLSHAAGRAMRARGRGGIINVSSVASYASMGTYSAAKGWVRLFSEGLSRELAGTGVTCMALCPGFTHTEFHERGRMSMSRLPEFMWLSAPKVVHQGLDDAARGKVVSVPGPQYKALVGVMSAVPRSLVRDVSSTLHRRRRTQG